MTTDPSPGFPQQRSGARLEAGGPLEGELIPPPIRVVNSEPGASRPVDAASRPAHLRLTTALLAGALVATLSGAGALEGYRWHLRRAQPVATGPSSTTLALARLGKDVGELKTEMAAARPDESVKVLKRSVDQLRADLDGLRSAEASTAAQLTARLDSKPVAAGPAVADVVARLDKLDHDPRLADLTARLDRIEHQVASPAPTGSIVPQSRSGSGQSVVSQTAPVQTARLIKPTVLDNWILRDVYSGIALVEGRGGSVREVVPGETLPGAGEVRSIERRGRGWIVVTSRGVIDTEAW